MTPVRIVHIIDHLGLGGAQTFLGTVLGALPTAAYESIIINLRRPTPLSRSFEAAGLRVLSLDLPRWSPRQLPRLIAVLRRLRPAIVHTHLTVGNTLGRLAAVCAGVPRIVVTDQVSVSQEIFSLPPLVVLASRLIERVLTGHTAAFVSPSTVIRQASAAARKWPLHKCHVVYNTIDCTKFTPADDRRRQRARLGLPDRPTVVTFGRLVPQKRISDVLRIARRVVQHAPDVQFLIAGDGPLACQLQAEIEQAGLQDCVQLLGFRQDTPALLAAADVYLSVSGGEALSVAILEAMASGCPVVATTAGGTAEQVLPGINGYLADIGAVDDLATHVLHLLQHDQQRAAMNVAARRYALTHFDAPQVAASLAALYAALLVDSGAQRSLSAPAVSHG